MNTALALVELLKKYQIERVFIEFPHMVTRRDAFGTCLPGGSPSGEHRESKGSVPLKNRKSQST